ncbi:MAG: hypothetical protein ACP5NZ_04280 [Nanobdellota archaeon]
MNTKKKKIASVLLFSLIIIFLGFGLVNACNLQLTKSASKQTVEPGEKFTLTLTYENTGEGNCTGGGVQIEDILDENLFYDGVYNIDLLNDADGEEVYYGWQSIPGYDESTNTLIWNAHVVSPGEKGAITIEVEALDKGECEDYEISNFFRAWSDQEDWKESNTITINVDDDCYSPGCGNNILDNGEECDDGNLIDGDNCSSTCEIEECECPEPPSCEFCQCNECSSCENHCNHECHTDCNHEEHHNDSSNECNEEEDSCDEDNCDKDERLKEIQQFCETNWVCSGWSECVNGEMTRECVDKNNCENEYGKPYEQSSCTDKVISTAYVLDENNGISIWVVLGGILAILLIIILILLIG